MILMLALAGPSQPVNESKLSVSVLVDTSASVPGTYGTMMLMVLAGYSCAQTWPVKTVATSDAIDIALWAARFLNIGGSFRFIIDFKVSLFLIPGLQAIELRVCRMAI